jgi:hypothetical protein
MGMAGVEALSVRAPSDIGAKEAHLATFGGFEDGVYMTSHKEDGTMTVTKLEVASLDEAKEGVQARTEESLISRRSCGAGLGCDDLTLNTGDTDAANADLQNQCGLGIRVPTGNSVYSIRGNIVAFYCQWTSAPVCTANSSRHANELITDCCGLYRAGSYSDDTAGSRTYSYGYTTTEKGWCKSR